MLKTYFKRLWNMLRGDPVLACLLILAATYFILAYITNPLRPSGILPSFLTNLDSSSAQIGWFGFYDQGEYLRLAKTLASFNLNELHSTYSYGIGYPLVAVPSLWLGLSSDPFLIFNFAAYIFSIFAIYKTAKVIISPTAGFIAGFGLLFATPLIYYTDQPWNSTVCLVVMSAILLTLTVKKVTKWHAIILGLLIGWAFAARYVDAIFLGFLAIASIYRGSFKALYSPIIYMSIAGSLILLPVLYSHYKVFGSPFRTPYVNHLGIGGVGGSDQGLQAYNLKRAPRAGLALFVSPRLAGSKDNDRGLLIHFFWALLAIPGAIILIKRKNNRIFFGTLIIVGFIATLFYLSFRASTPGSLKYGELHYFKMFWPGLVLLAVAFIDRLLKKSVTVQTKGRLTRT